MAEPAPSRSAKPPLVLVLGGLLALLGVVVVVVYVSRAMSGEPEARRRATPPDEENPPMAEPESAPAEVPAARPAPPENEHVVPTISTTEEQPKDEPPQLMGPRPVVAGPVDELKEAFAHATRDDKAHEVESGIREIARSDAVPGDIFRGAACRNTVCKLEVEWSPANEVAYHGMLIRLSQKFRPDMAIEPRGPANEQGAMLVDIYLPRDVYGSPAAPE